MPFIQAASSAEARPDPTNSVDSWMTGVNSNVEGKQTRKIMRYGGSFPSFREHCDGVVADGYRGIVMT